MAGPRRRHQARRQRRAPDHARAAQARPRARDRRVGQGVGRGLPGLREAGRGRPRAGARGRRPLHPRHRAARVAPDRQPAARPLRPPGRPGRVALLPLRRGRPRAPVRGRPHLPHPRPARPGGQGDRRGGADRGQDALEADRERPEEGRGAELPDPQARPRVRRRDEPAARDHLRVPRPHPRGRGHGRDGARADRRRDRADDGRVPGRRLHRRVGPRRAVDPARADVPGRRSRSRTSTATRSCARTWSRS